MNHTSTIISSLKEVFSRPRYAVSACLVAAAFLFVSIWLRNVSFLKFLLASDAFAFNTKIEWLTVGSFNFFMRNFTGFQMGLILASAVLIGMNAAMIVYYLKLRATAVGTAGLGALGTLGALFGVGCASCGSVILTNILGFSAAAAFLGALPLRGGEFSIAGIIILSVSTASIARKIQFPLVCKT